MIEQFCFFYSSSIDRCTENKLSINQFESISNPNSIRIVLKPSDNKNAYNMFMTLNTMNLYVYLFSQVISYYSNDIHFILIHTFYTISKANDFIWTIIAFWHDFVAAVKYECDIWNGKMSKALFHVRVSIDRSWLHCKLHSISSETLLRNR